MTDAAEAIVIRAGEMYSEYCQLWATEGRPFSLEDDLRLWTQSQQAGRLAFEAVELLWRTSDSSVTGRRGQRMQRYYKDVSMYRGHGAAQPDIIAPWAAQVTLGLPFENPMAPRPRPTGADWRPHPDLERFVSHAGQGDCGREARRAGTIVGVGANRHAPECHRAKRSHDRGSKRGKGSGGIHSTTAK